MTGMRASRAVIVTMAIVWMTGTGAIGCAGGRAPGWVDGRAPAAYPEARFVSALGSGAELEEAQAAARVELARVFSAGISSEVEASDRQSRADGLAAETSELLSKPRVDSALELQGVDVPTHWRDPESGEVWALAVLDRARECDRVRAETADLVAEQDAALEASRGAGNPLAAIRASVQAVRLGVALDVLEARSRVLGGDCLAARPVSTPELRRAAADQLSRLSFVVNTRDVDPGSGRSNGPLDQLREEIAGNLSRLGFQVGPAEQARMVPIDAQLRLSRVARGAEPAEYRYEGFAEIGSPVAGEPAMIAVETDGTESHPEPSSARLSARRSGEKALARLLDERLRAFIDERDPR